MLLLAALAFACEDPPPETVATLGSRVELAAGDVWLAADKGERRRLITGAMLPEEAAIEVGDGARALLRLDSGAGVFLRGGSRAAITAEKLELLEGELWADVPAGEQQLARFDGAGVQVTAADAGLDLKVDGEAVAVYVARGLAVVASAAGRVEVQSGEQVEARKSSVPRSAPVAFWDDWTGGMADRALAAGIGGRAAGRLYGIDRRLPGSPPQELQITAQSVKIYIRDGIAHTTVDQRFFNPGGSELEGWYWFTVPEGAAVERFAWEVNGQLVDARMIERKTAAAAYEAAVQASFDPALLEWVDGRSFRARVYPVPPTGERRLVLAYTELLPLADGAYRYVYPMGGESEARIQEFSLEVDLGDAGEELEIAAAQDAKIDAEKRTVTMRRSGFLPRSDFLLEVRPAKDPEPVRIKRFSTGGDEADYVMLRYAPDVTWPDAKSAPLPGDVVVVLDTSAGGDQAERQVRQDSVEAVLRALSTGDRFAVLAADLDARVVYPAEGLTPADDASVSAAMEALSEVGSAGATDLGEMFGTALGLLHESEQPALLYIGDGRATVGELSAEALSERLRRSLAGSRARLFTLAVGADADLALLERLARTGGGRMFRIDREEQAVQEALRFVGQVKTPTITDLLIDAGGGLDQVFSTATGKVSEGEEVVLVARTHHGLPGAIKVTGRLAGKPFETSYKADVDKGGKHGYLPSIWARMYLERLMGDGLDGNRGSIIGLGLAHSLMTPFTSFLALESPAAYLQRGMAPINRFRFGAVDRERSISGAEIAVGATAGAIPLGLSGCMSLGREEPAEDSEPRGRYPTSPTQEVSGAPPAPPAAEPSPVSAADSALAEAARMLEQLQGAMEAQKKGEGGDQPHEAGARAARPRKSAVTELDDLLGGDTGYGAKDKVDRSEDRPMDEGRMGMAGIGLRGTGAGGGGTVSKRPGLATAGPAGAVDGTPTTTIAVGNPYAGDRDGKPMFNLRTCSDASRRPLHQRRMLWLGRLASVTEPAQYLRVFTEAGERCELPGWRERKLLTDLIEERLSGREEIRQVLLGFQRYPQVASYLRQRIVRRSLDPDTTMGLWFGAGVNWAAIQRGLAAIKEPEKRLVELRRVLAQHPDDSAGRELLVITLLEAGQDAEALAEATRLKRDALASPVVLRILCDLQAEAGQPIEARRSCSELVEFNPGDSGARTLLGDLFLRRGWYAAAYRQYRTLTEAANAAPEALLRLAAAAAGMGKVDEALRIERKVAAGDGDPGPADPRRWARLLSAVRLARMITEERKASADAEKIAALERNLKRTQAVTQPGTLLVVVWEDLSTPLALSATRGTEPLALADRVEAAAVGLQMIDLGPDPAPDILPQVRFTGPPPRHTVAFTVMTLAFDGKAFTIDLAEHSLSSDKTAILLAEPAGNAPAAS
jgi:Flp pilus assembly protein TadD